MLQKINYSKILDNTIEDIRRRGVRPRLMLHSCCAPCSSYVLEYLSAYFDITVFYYNPNIYPEEEFYKRLDQQRLFIERFPASGDVGFIGTQHRSEEFYAIAGGLETEPEGGRRCHACFRLRLKETALAAVKEGADYFTTTLSISPYKDSQVLNRIGGEIAAQTGVRYLYSDFKKKDGYKRSTELSREYGMYRQNYCGCVYSLKARTDQQGI